MFFECLFCGGYFPIQKVTFIDNQLVTLNMYQNHIILLQ